VPGELAGLKFRVVIREWRPITILMQGGDLVVIISKECKNNRAARSSDEIGKSWDARTIWEDHFGQVVL
jgi:hypothetical protein